MNRGVHENSHPRRLAFFNLGFFRPKLRQHMKSLGYSLVPFGIGAHEAVIVWGRKPVSKRGLRYAQVKNLPLLTIEDGFIRSLKPGWQEAPRSLSLDWGGAYFDASADSDLQGLIANAKPSAKTKSLLDLQLKFGISKYNAHPRNQELAPKAGYVLVVDQVKDDQSIAFGRANQDRFDQALAFAQKTYPHDPILIRNHPSGSGYYDRALEGQKIQFHQSPCNPYDLIANAKAVVVVTSQMGLDAIFMGKTPHVFGAPFYAGWGLTDDHGDLKARGKTSAEALYQAVVFDYNHYFSQSGATSDAKTEIFALHDEMRQSALTHQPVKLSNMRAWKRPHMKRFFPNQKGEQELHWGRARKKTAWSVEDGFLRSRGLGAKLVPPLSLVVDKKGIYFDPTKPSDLEELIHARAQMHPLEIERAKNLREKITSLNISKYNLPKDSAPKLPKGKKILLVVGQVEDDASIQLGATGNVLTNAELLERARHDFPDHYLIYKPHPDVMAGLRIGEIKADMADMIYDKAGLDGLWPHIDALATMTSLSGFEALLRDVLVTCYGMPFYADWGLTTDHAPSTGRRGKASLEALIYACLIDYPLYLDPKTRRLSTAEVIIDRLANGDVNYPYHLRAMTWVQQMGYRFADYARKFSKSK